MTNILDDLRANEGGARIWKVPLALVANPGFLCITLHRIAHAARQRGVVGSLLGRLAWRLNVLLSSCYLHPSARIGAGLALPHPVGVVIGAGAKLGRGVKLYQNVTIGTVGRETFVYPEIGDNATLFAGCVVVGSVRLGPGCIIGANSVVTKDVPAGATAVGAPARVLTPELAATAKA